MQLKSKHFISGYTLIELAIVLVAVGLMLGIGAGIYNVYLKQKEIKDTQISVRVVSNALADFKGRNGRYPCPAPLNAQRTDPNYGRSQCDPITVGAFNAKGVFGQNRQSVLPPPAPAVTPGVMVGAVPFRHLNLREDDVVDGYGARLLYAVTLSQTKDDEYTLNGGGIEVKDSAAAQKSALNPPNSADLVVLSFGPDSAGAVMKSGVNSNTPCPAVAVLENKNCAFGNEAIYQSGPRNTPGINANTQMDDTITFFARGQQEPWNAGTTVGTEDDIYNKNPDSGQVGIMVENPGSTDLVVDNELKAEVAGNTRVRNSVVTEEIVQSGDESTMTMASVIGGDIAAGTGGLKCDNAGEFISGITRNNPDCAYAAVTCRDAAGNPVPVIGIEADGSLQCKDDTCPGITVNYCGGTQIIPAGNKNDIHHVRAGDSLDVTYRCRLGLWSPTGARTGVCVCVPSSRTETVPCGPGFSGTRKVRIDTTCPEGTEEDEVQLSSSCRCVGGSQTRTRDCPSGQTGSITQRRTLSCTGTSSGTWSGWTDVSNTCEACTVVKRRREINCPNPEDPGKIRQESTQNCSTGKWGPWNEISRTCNPGSCVPGKRQTRSVPCGSGQIGEMQQERFSLCPSGWGAWTATGVNSCAPGTAHCRWTPHGGGQVLSSKIGGRLGSSCTCGATGGCYVTLGGGNYMVYSGCGCE